MKKEERKKEKKERKRALLGGHRPELTHIQTLTPIQNSSTTLILIPTLGLRHEGFVFGGTGTLPSPLNLHRVVAIWNGRHKNHCLI